METIQVNDWMVPLRQLSFDLGDLAPRLLAALMVLAAGLAVAWLSRYLAKLFFKMVRLEKKQRDIWIFRLWSHELHGRKPTESMASFVFYIVFFATMLLAIHVLGVAGGEKVLDSLMSVVPRVLSFILILFLGVLLAMFFSVVTQLVLAGSGADHPRFWGKVIAWGTFAMTVMFSLEPLGLAGQFLTVAVLILVGLLGLSAAIAFGLGCKDLAREFMIEWLKEEKEGR